MNKLILTLEEELALPENVKETKKNKLIIAGCCGSIYYALKQIDDRASGAPLEDDDKHAELMREFTRLVKEAEKAMWKAAQFGMS